MPTLEYLLNNPLIIKQLARDNGLLGRDLFKVKYTYSYPSSAGPFRGSLVMSDRFSKGGRIAGTFGDAVVTSCSKVKAPELDNGQLYNLAKQLTQ